MSNKPNIRRKGKFVSRELDEMDQITVALLMHFPVMRTRFKSQEEIAATVESLTCFDCEDLKAGVCEGEGLCGNQCLDCMADKVMVDFCESGTIGTVH